MTKKKGTLRALLVSVLSLVLCMSMLIGTTFAWFTDSVSSMNNVITSGNLDMVLEYKTDWDDQWAPVETDTELFGTKDLWEPGHTELVYLRISNAGDLAFKCNLAVNVISETASTNVYGEEFKLSEYLKVGKYVQAQFNDQNDYTALLPFMFSDRVSALNNMTETISFTEEMAIVEDIPILAGDYGAQIVVLAITMPETVGNEANYKTGTTAPEIKLGVNVVATQYTAEKDSFGTDYDKDATYPEIEKMIPVSTADELEDAIANVKDGETINLVNDITGDVTFDQNPNTDVVIKGNGHTFAGAFTIDGKSQQIPTAGLTIENVVFKADSISTDACINLGAKGNNNTRYTNHVTIKNCVFDVPGAVGIKSYTGGDKNLTVINCTATANAHSLMQIKNIDGLVIEKCTINSVRGVNLNNTPKALIKGCTFDVQKYAVRFGESVQSTPVYEEFTIENSTLKSANLEGDPVIEFRADALENATLNLIKTTLEGTKLYTGADNVTINVTN